MQALGIVDSVDEGSDITPGVAKVFVGLAVDLFGFQRAHKAFGFGVGMGIARPAHADDDAAGITVT